MAITPENLNKVAPQQKQAAVAMPAQKAAPPKVNINQTRQQIAELTQKEGISPALIIRAGEFAQAAIKDHSLYPVFRNAIINFGIAKPDEISPQIDMVGLGKMAAAGRMLSQGGST